ncbi:hypothetical protein PR202_gb13684 [Eleusine coracana subsp. coracana]|uniref:Uncharacterized protein n=1 Tax=Eleusine coracana subsp. coracana TaxID=191504 RepID=A0AAV5ET85_ELECO|nr:hypothetical protein PR202_gb13684 [Eleusine coracana subsp. coracana]
MLHRLLSAVGLSSAPTTPWPAAATVDNSPPKPTESAIVAETVPGSHVLAIKGYCRTKALGKGEFISSASFRVGGCRWSILYYPDGRGPTNAGWISVFLQLDKCPGVDARAWCRLALLDAAGDPVPAHGLAVDGIHRFSPKKGAAGGASAATWGCYRLITRKALERSSPAYLKDDCFRVRCDVTVYKDIHREDAAAGRFVAVPPANMRRHMEWLLRTGNGADVTFEVAGTTTTVAAHRSILAARSPVFMAELFGPMKENTSSRVRVDDMEARVFKALLYFVYTDEMPEVEEEGEEDKVVMAQHLLVAADRYSLDRLRLMCEDRLCGLVDVSNVGTVLALAEQHEYQGLKKACFRFLLSGSNLKAAMPTPGFEHLFKSCPSIVNELLAKAATLISS